MRKIYLLALTATLIFAGCDKNENLVIFSVEDDVKLGKQVSDEIAGNPSTYEILSESQYPDVYAYLNNMKNDILNSGEIAYKDDFAWELHVIKNDSVLNAFATPGGYIYIYTGLIKYLDNADDLAGVMGHEIAHADQRHTVRNLQKMYGVQILLSILVGEQSSALEQIVGQITGTLAGLKFSREYEEEADANSVEYLAQTEYACNGAARFFIKLEEQGGATQTPVFLSTHPSPENRIESINTKADEVGCDKTLASNTNYDQFKNSLP